MTRPIDALVAALRAQEERGVKDIFLDEGAKEILRDWHRQTQAARAAVAGRPVVPQSAPERPAQSQPARTQPTEPDKPAISTIVVRGDSPAERIQSLRELASDWGPARALGSLREAMVFSTGNPEADLMLVGEAPGYHEEQAQQPFVGPAGQKLNEILTAMGLSRESVYISNIVKFRPRMPNQTTNNRKPTREEMESCLPFIREEVKVVRPKLIVALGATAAEGLLGLSGSVGQMRKSWHEFEGIPARVTYHPAYLLHGSAALKDKRSIWEDMLEVMGRLDLPISERQRGFFLPKS